MERHLTGHVAAVSVGIVDGINMLDLDYSEDSRAEVDFNVVGTDAGTYVELQGTAEGKPFDRAQLDGLLDLANVGLGPAVRGPGRRPSRRSAASGGGAPPAARRDALPPQAARAARAAPPAARAWSCSRPTTSASTGEPDETGLTFETNARIKARYYAGGSGLPTLADDSGLEVDALGGGPGVRTRRYAGPDATDADNNAKLLAELARPARPSGAARATCACSRSRSRARPARAAALRIVARRGTCRGRIATGPRGDGGFGYDPIFEPRPEPPGGRTLGQWTAAEKHAISHRARAAARMAPVLRELLATARRHADGGPTG